MPEVLLKLFFSYSHKDEALRDELAKHLRTLIREGVISSWHDHKILPGEEWDHQINDNLNTADIILLLVSSDFIDSDYCWDVEVKKAIERHDAGEACVIPVILRSVEWKRTPFAKLQALPKNAEPVVSRNWHNQDDAFTDIHRGIRKAADNLNKQRDERRQKQEADKLQLQEQEEETRKLLQQERERLRLQEQQEEADRLKRQEAERLQRQQEEADRLQRQQEQKKADKLRQQQQSTDNDLLSEKGVDYRRLRDLLKAGQWKEADQETLVVMLKATGKEQQGWLDIESIYNFPCTDLRTIDQLWVKYSDGHFGFSVQKRIWESVGKDSFEFSNHVGWRKRKRVFSSQRWRSYSDLSFTKNSPQGHLPTYQNGYQEKWDWSGFHYKLGDEIFRGGMENLYFHWYYSSLFPLVHW
ncbi:MULTISPECIES: GUN4 domain-containing protein [unclassified Nostoc]|uniref:GUN4 domain-containing protein n=1 Tax=unclassified Nostoc TaxID=2593658 RepID=UPI002622CD5E|nr:GUN4 domain-containing protein [Nostoc sp. S13]MDF5735144.1 GUN4 domain-containing protein [Nostoc sp. S13]